LGPDGSKTVIPEEVIRSTEEEREYAITSLNQFQERNKVRSEEALKALQQVAIANGNIFEALMETVKSCSLGQISHALYEVGGQYRRNM
jgi:methylmalonyl-CoA mutase